MKAQKICKTKIATVVLVLVLSMSASIILLPAANAHSPPWNIVSFAYVNAQPNPIGVNQIVSITMWVDTPMPSALVTNDIRRHDYTLTITAPDGKSETKKWPIVSDTTGLQFTQYTPTLVGTYTLKFVYPGQVYTWSGTNQNDTFLSATATATFTVQSEQLPAPITSYPMPTEYWTRPIESQNTDWWAVASNWLRGPYITFGTSATEVTADISGRYTPDGTVPNSAHVMWTKPIADGGVVGGSRVGLPGNTYYMGGSYNVRFAAGIAMYGRLYYQEPYGNSGGGGDYVCVDLRTGKEVWRANVTSAGAPSFGYLYDFESGNQHGVLPEGLLFTTNFARAYDPSTGVLTTMNITNVPSGQQVVGPKGEILSYVLTNRGNATNPNWYLAQWNSSRLFVDSTGMSPANWYSGNVPANCPITPTLPNASMYWNGSTYVTNTVRSQQGWSSIQSPAYDWNVSLPLINGGSWSIIRYGTFFNQQLLLQQGSLGIGPRDTGYGANITIVSLKPGSIGTILLNQYYPPAPGNVTRKIIATDTTLGVFVTEDKETLDLNCFSLADGSLLWTAPRPLTDFDTLRTTSVTAWGKLFCAGYNGILYAYDLTDGSLLYSYGNGGAGNSTRDYGTAYGWFPIFLDVVADGKVILATTEHSPNSPWYKNSLYRCIDANTGKELWTIMGWGTGMYAGGYDLIADGTFVFANMYDMQIYAIGKGPSAITVDAPMAAVTQGSGIVIRGRVTDISSGTEQDVVAKRFPNGVPAVSDDSQAGWMEYIYMQKPKPANVTGVTVQLTITAPDGTTYGAAAVSDDLGSFATSWTPPTTGLYKIVAAFQGSESYWPSSADTSFYASAAPAPYVQPTETPIQPTSTPPATATPLSPSPSQALPPQSAGLPTEVYVGIAAVVIIAIVAAIALVLRRRK